MKSVQKIIRFTLLVYSVALTIVIFLGSAVFGVSNDNLILPALSLPVIAYFLGNTFKVKRGKKISLYYSFILVTVMNIAGFASASSPPQFASAFLFVPITIYFWLQVMPKKRKKLPIKHGMLSIIPGTEISKNDEPEELKRIKDEYPTDKFGRGFELDRRMFLKLIGSAGISVLMLALFTKKSHAAFFGSVPGPGTVALKDTTGAQVDPAIKHPTDGYRINQLDDSSPAYYGFTEKGGAWFIMKEDSSGNYRYAKGTSDFSTNWTGRAALSYDYYDVIF
ncbi:MAG: hypothetical protein KBD51_02090 [Candidatus Levybacteria bacterium]|nr:hypothetical protein [Candidatus Levybacteria bacterium]